MDPVTLSALIGAGASIGGSALSFLGGTSTNQMSQNLALQQMMQQQGFVNAQRMDQYAFRDYNAEMQKQFLLMSQDHAMNMARGNWDQAQDLFQKNMAMQQEFAQNGLAWKVQDARNAGIHPLYALGSPGVSAAPIQISGSGSPASGGFSPTGYSPVSAGAPGVPSFDNPGRAFADMGQDISRAVRATMNREQRVQHTKTALELERDQLQNDLLKSQIARNMAALNPPMPSGSGGSSGGAGVYYGSTNVGPYEAKPTEVNTVNPSSASTAAGPPQPSVQWVHTSTGGLSSEPPKVSKAEDEFGAPLMMEHLYRNRVLPMLGASSMAPPRNVWPKSWGNATGTYWDYLYHEWRPTYHSSGKGAVGRYIDWRRGQ